MFGSTGETPYDLRFSIARIPVRVHPVFWLTAAIIGWAPERLDLVLVHVLCIFVSILVHELGHALVTRYFGWRPEIVLEFFGGYATTTRHSPWRNIAVTAAGPLAGFSLLLLVIVFDMVGGQYRQHELIDKAVRFLIFINLIWNLVNLLPVFPLDGGQIVREFLTWLRPRDGQAKAFLLSTVTAGGIALWALYCRLQNIGFLGLAPLLIALIFGYLAVQSYQTYQAIRRGYW